MQGVNEHIIASQEAQTRDTCRHIVQDLTSPEGMFTVASARGEEQECLLLSSHSAFQASLDYSTLLAYTQTETVLASITLW